MAVLTPVAIVAAGVVYDETTFSAATVTGDAIAANPRVFVAVHNAAVGDKIVTFVTPGNVQGYAIENQAVTVAAGTTKLVGPFGTVFYDEDRQVTFTYDSNVDVTVKAFSI